MENYLLSVTQSIDLLIKNIMTIFSYIDLLSDVSETFTVLLLSSILLNNNVSKSSYLYYNIVIKNNYPKSSLLLSNLYLTPFYTTFIQNNKSIFLTINMKFN